jgi:hypothetical protein
MGFIQFIEITTKRVEEIQTLIDAWVASSEGDRTARRATLTADRDRPDTYLQIVEFPSHDDAMANSDLPQTGRFAEQLIKLCDSPPKFRNLDVRRADDLS